MVHQLRSDSFRAATSEITLISMSNSPVSSSTRAITTDPNNNTANVDNFNHNGFSKSKPTSTNPSYLPFTNGTTSVSSAFPVKSNISPDSSNGSQKSYQFCRICHEGDNINCSGLSPSSSNSSSTSRNREPLIAPCHCIGSVAMVHLSCLEHWLTTSNSDRCELCNFIYKTKKMPRTWTEFLTDSDNQFNIRNMIADIICFFLLTPLLVISTYLCSIGAHQYYLRERWEAVGLVFLSVFLLVVYFTWCHVTLRYHVGVWQTWARTHQRVYISFGDDSVSQYRRCWLAILALMFFECFYRKLKNRFNRDVQPPRFSSAIASASSPEEERCVEELTSELAYRNQFHHHDRNNNRGGGRGVRFPGPTSITSSSKEMCRIPMEMMVDDDDEEPPPSYEEALSYAKLVTKFQFAPYGDFSIPECEVMLNTHSDDGNEDDDDICCTSSMIVNLSDDDHQHSSESCSSAMSPISNAFKTNEENENSEDDGEEEEEDDDDDEDTDQSSDSLTDVESDMETLINDRFQSSASKVIGDFANKREDNEECSNVKVPPSPFSISKNSESFRNQENHDYNADSQAHVKVKGATREVSIV